MIPIESKSKYFYKLQKYIRPSKKYHRRKLLIYGEQDISEYVTSTLEKDSGRRETSQYFHSRQRKRSDNEEYEELDKECNIN